MSFRHNLIFTVRCSNPHAQAPSWINTPLLAVIVFAAGGRFLHPEAETRHSVLTRNPPNMGKKNQSLILSPHWDCWKPPYSWCKQVSSVSTWNGAIAIGENDCGLELACVRSRRAEQSTLRGLFLAPSASSFFKAMKYVRSIVSDDYPLPLLRRQKLGLSIETNWVGST
jgi:hypothetical protein